MSTTAAPAQKTFDPSRYLSRLPRRQRDASGSWTVTETEYLEVKWRLLWLRTDHPDAAIETEMALHQDGIAVFRARVAIPGGGSATGWGHETAAGFDDYFEKAETKALGRALAALGYGTQFCEDFDFASGQSGQRGHRERLRVVDSPAVPLPNAATGHSSGQEEEHAIRPRTGEDGDDGTMDPTRASGGRSVPFATEPQVKAIYAIARGSLALEPDEIELRSRERFGVLPQALNRRQASAFIDALKAEAGAAS